MTMSTTTYSITPAQAASITRLEMAFGTTKLLPPVEAIPASFLCSTGEAKPYLDLVNALFYGLTLPAGEIELKDGLSAETLRECVLAHLRSFEPKHEHKMAGVAYMLSLLATLKPVAETA